MEGEFVVYVLKNPQSLRYIGIASDLEKRIAAHAAGLSVFTRNRGPWELLWNSIPMSHTEALKLEKNMKRQKGGQGLFRLMDEFNKSS
jgi:putative endonuclease